MAAMSLWHREKRARQRVLALAEALGPNAIGGQGWTKFKKALAAYRVVAVIRRDRDNHIDRKLAAMLKADAAARAEDLMFKVDGARAEDL